MFEHIKDVADNERRIERTRIANGINVVQLLALGLMFLLYL